MSRHADTENRRRFLKAGLLGLIAAPFAGLLVGRRATAADDGDLPKLDPESTQAKNLSYTHDASSVDHPAKTSDDQTCATCQLYQGAEDEQWGKCSLFPGKLVNADGWCTAFTPKS